jgi:hypothetical protein
MGAFQIVALVIAAPSPPLPLNPLRGTLVIRRKSPLGDLGVRVKFPNHIKYGGTELHYCTQMTQIQTQIYADPKECISEYQHAGTRSVQHEYPPMKRSDWGLKEYPLELFRFFFPASYNIFISCNVS